jgi:hypothetical protein
LKIKLTKNKILVAAIVLLVLTAAWVYDSECPGNNHGKAALPDQTPVGETGEKGLHQDTALPGRGPLSSPEGKSTTLPGEKPAPAPGENFAPSPGEKPTPAHRQDLQVDSEAPLTCRLSVSCETIFDNLDRFNKDKLEMLPEGGIIFPSQEVTFYNGESIFDVLQREMKKQEIHLEFTMVPLHNSYYVEGINNIYEFDCGELSGWMCKVNDSFLGYGCSNYLLKDGDTVAWIYTCDLGRDIGAAGPEGVGQ